MNRIKIKEWVKEHKKELVITSVCLAIGAVGGIEINKRKLKEVETINKALIGVYKDLSPAMRGSVGCHVTKLNGNTSTLKDCGKLIKELEQCSFYNPDREITGMAVFVK